MKQDLDFMRIIKSLKRQDLVNDSTAGSNQAAKYYDRTTPFVISYEKEKFEDATIPHDFDRVSTAVVQGVLDNRTATRAVCNCAENPASGGKCAICMHVSVIKDANN